MHRLGENSFATNVATDAESQDVRASVAQPVTIKENPKAEGLPAQFGTNLLRDKGE